MRTIFLLRGAPSSGKSTWVKENNLSNYCLSVDEIRDIFQSPVIKDNGEYVISLGNDNPVWDLLLKLLERRMRKGEFIIIDATHYKSVLLNTYKKLIDKYRYRAFVVDFTDISLEENLRRNSLRTPLKRVPEETIRKQHAIFSLDDKEVSGRFKIITRDEAVKIAHSKGDDLLFNYNKFKKIFIFGDIHGCFDPLDKFFKENPFSEEYAYIFTGDYLDRGIQNKEVLDLLLPLSKNRNVLFLEGNHEIWLRLYADDKGAETKLNPDLVKELNQIDKAIVNEIMENKIRSSGFIKKTIPQIESFSKADLRQFCRKLAQMAFIEFRGKKYVITHGGIPCEPRMVIPTDQIIKGTGGYENLDDTYDTFISNLPDNYIMVHGHRNVLALDAEQRNGRVYNLCSDVEIGADLRVLELRDDGTKVVRYYSNEVFDPKSKDNKYRKYDVTDNLKLETDEQLVAGLYSSRCIIRKELGEGLVSFNFSRDAFRDHKWNSFTVKARGLFVDEKTNKVVARSYDKFFNWNETDNNTPIALNRTLKFPVVAYRKENGFLAIVSYDKNNNSLLVCSKSTNTGDYVKMIKECLKQYESEEIRNLREFLKNNNVSLIFECIHSDDRHIIDYHGQNNLVLLDIVENSFETKLWDFERVSTVANTFGFSIKEKEFVFNDFTELFNFVKAQDKDSNFNTRTEGWVFVDQNNYMVKYKTRFYKFWKAKRTMLEAFQKGRNIDKTFATEEDINVYNFIKYIQANNPKFNEFDIIDIERMYYYKPSFKFGFIRNDLT